METILDFDWKPAPPGFFLIELLPLAGGGFHPAEVLKTPVTAWLTAPDGATAGRPRVAGDGIVRDKWAVLTPDGEIIVDDFSAIGLDDEPFRCLADWIASEVAWLENPSEWAADGPVYSGAELDEIGFITPAEKIHRLGGPVAKAVLMAVAVTPHWEGTAGELLTTLSAFGDPQHRRWPASPDAFVLALADAARMLGDAGVAVKRGSDRRIRISR